MKTILKIVLIVLAAPLAIIAIWLTIFAIDNHYRTESKITAALRNGFPGAEVSVNDRVDWSYFNQICVDVMVRPKSPIPNSRSIVMVEGDDDGGTWGLSRLRYRSIRECKDDFNRG